MKNKPRWKPRGILKFAKIVSGNPEASGVFNVELPDSKDAIELDVLNKFLLSVSKRQDIPIIFTGAPIQNKENDLDFSIDTNRGRRWIELMEFAPLEAEASGYKTAKAVRNSYDDAKWIFQKLKGKSDKYGETKNETILLVYTTEDRFSLGITATKILKYWAATGSQCFEMIFMFRPAFDDGSVEIVFPAEVDEAFNPEDYKGDKSLILDTSSAKIQQSEHGSSISIFISPQQLLAMGFPFPRNSLCPCGSGERYKNCHGKLK